ncbi:MAG: hypothetical protein JRN21_09995 [Nitrososphaerota archaeon]|nr:hypothetical protein [Nitrososphaerota archaeon]
MTSPETIMTKNVEVTVRGVKFTGELNFGAYEHGKFDPDMIWASMLPTLTRKLKKAVSTALTGSLSRGYSIGDNTVESFMKEYVRDYKNNYGKWTKSLALFQSGCLQCRAGGFCLPAGLVEEFRAALGVDKDANFKPIVSTTVFLAQKWTGEWKPTGPETAERDYEGEQYCVFHGVSKYEDTEVTD